ncbi:hypothetical protein BX600DRAFT_468717 [Xylariales sp. PMI_506]|nr:hypothetical protein BX600DRAFT_468717 [Xylariales sp. PMI_506]
MDAESPAALGSPEPGVELRFWDEAQVPPETEEIFQALIRRTGEDPISYPFEPLPEDCSSWVRDESSPVHNHASFGDGHGTTATVNAYGHLMQFGAHLGGVGHSGMFSADQADTFEPCGIEARARDLESMSQTSEFDELTYGLEFTSFQPTRAAARIWQRPPSFRYVHNRWPRYEFEGDEDVQVAIQWMANEGIVVQQCLVTNLSRNPDMEVGFKFHHNMCIRDLDDQDMAYDFNDEYMFSQEVNSMLKGPNGYGWVCIHRMAVDPDQADSSDKSSDDSSDDNDDENTSHFSSHSFLTSAEIDRPIFEAVAVVVNIHVNGVTRKWNDEASWKSKFGGSDRPLEIVVSYRMIHLNSHISDWNRFLTPIYTTDVSRYLRNAHFCPLNLTTLSGEGTSGFDRPLKVALIAAQHQSDAEARSVSDHFDFLTHRHLEHILSVCTVTVRIPAEGGEREDAIALTCGDMSSHMILNSASFFAFRFLLEIDKCLRKMHSSHPYITSLKERVSHVCRGHLRWLTAVALSPHGEFHPRYTVDGTALKSSSIDGEATNTPFQLLKAVEFSVVYDSPGDRALSMQVIDRVFMRWLVGLKRRDKRERYAWPHSSDGDFSVFRLDDHIWICKCLKSLEKIGAWQHIQNHAHGGGGGISDNHNMELMPRGRKPQGDEADVESLAKRFSSENVRREILQRFTAEHTESTERQGFQTKKRMRLLAVTRSPRETRLLLHARDTIIFYDGDIEDSPVAHEPWKNSLELQKRLANNDEQWWDNALRYGLAIVMGTREISLNRKPPRDLVSNAVKVLLGCARPNGFIGGQIDGLTKAPILFLENRDAPFYFHASFEIPYIIISHARRILDLVGRVSTDPLPAEAPLMPGPVSPIVGSFQNVEAPQERQRTIPTAQDPGTVTFRSESMAKISNVAAVIKKTVPFNNLFDDKNIVRLEEEWMYNYPSFLDRDGPLRLREMLKSARKFVISSSGGVIEKALDSLPAKTDIYKVFSKPAAGWLIDIPRKRTTRRGKSRNPKGYTFLSRNWILWNNLERVRTPALAKKRMVWLWNANAQTALICFLTSPTDEWESMSLFFDRHASFENYFIEEVSMIANRWETEFHLSFYMLVDSSATSQMQKNISSSEDGEYGRAIPSLVSATFSDTPAKDIVRASMSFRFVGDFFDRYWTCYFIEHVPMHDSDIVEDEADSPARFMINDPSTDRSWGQRRVLELRFLDRMMTRLVRHTEDIVKAIKLELGFSKSLLSSAAESSSTFRNSRQWQRYRTFLQLMEEDLELSIDAITKWERREDDRGLERPRWTSNDEKKYRTTINKLKSALHRKVRELNLASDHVSMLRQTIESTQDRIRNDQEFRGSENLRYFTYVTVVFLPLGFATSIFSMSGGPDAGLIASVAIFAAVALIVTVVALFNAKALADVFDDVYSIISGPLSRSRGESLLARQHKEAERRRNQNSASNDKVPGNEKRTAGPKKANSDALNDNYKGTSQHRRSKIKSWAVWFWVEYFFVELPARRVLLGVLTLRKLEWKAIALLRLIGGILFLPLFIVSWLVRVICYNIVDVLRYLKGILIQQFTPSPMDNYEIKFEDRLREWMQTPESLRPLRSGPLVEDIEHGK